MFNLTRSFLLFFQAILQLDKRLYCFCNKYCMYYPGSDLSATFQSPGSKWTLWKLCFVGYFMRQCDFIISSLHRAWKVSTVFCINWNWPEDPYSESQAVRTAQKSAHVKIIVYSVPTRVGTVFKACLQLVQEIVYMCLLEVSWNQIFRVSQCPEQ